jgi:adenylate cyclase
MQSDTEQYVKSGLTRRKVAGPVAHILMGMTPELPDFEAAGLLDGIDDPPARQARVDLLERLAADGFTVEELTEAAAEGRLALLPVDRVLRDERPSLTPRQIADQSGLPLDTLRRLWRALGLAEAGDDEVAFTGTDLEAAKTVGQFHAAGLDEDALVVIGQVIGHGASRLSETLREIVGEALLEAGDDERSLGLRYGQATEYMVPMLTPILSYVLGVHLREQIKSDVIHQEELASGRLQGGQEVTVCFADLVGFTRLGERVAPAVLGVAGRQLTEMAIEAARPPVRLVKMIGDAAMLVAPGPTPVVEAGLMLARLVESTEGMPSLRVGVASGEAVVHSGDWFGPPVNLASRIAAISRPDSLLATKRVRDRTLDAFQWSHAGRRRFKGVRGEVRLFRARHKLA